MAMINIARVFDELVFRNREVGIVLDMSVIVCLSPPDSHLEDFDRINVYNFFPLLIKLWDVFPTKIITKIFEAATIAIRILVIVIFIIFLSHFGIDI